MEGFGLSNRLLYERLLAAGIYDAASDVARIELLHRLGGVYVDADSRCLRPMDDAPFLEAGFFCTEEIPPRGNFLVTNAFMGSAPGSPVARRYIDHIGRAKVRCIHGRQGAAFCCAWRHTGPMALTAVIARTDALVLPPSAFFTKTITGEKIQGSGWGEHYWSSTGGRSPKRVFPGAVGYEEAV